MLVRNPYREPCEVDRGRMLAPGATMDVKERDSEVARKLKSGRLRKVEVKRKTQASASAAPKPEQQQEAQDG